MGVWSQKESMQFKALQHTKMMEANYVQDIQLSTTLSMIYQPPFDVKLTNSGNAALMQHQSKPLRTIDFTKIFCYNIYRK